MNYTKAKEYFEKALEYGYTESLVYLGKIYKEYNKGKL